MNINIRDYAKQNKPSFNFMGRVKIQFLVISCVILISLFATQLVFAANLATDGQRLSSVQSEIAKIEAENTNIKVKIAETSSFNTLFVKAQNLGFNKPATIITP